MKHIQSHEDAAYRLHDIGHVRRAARMQAGRLPGLLQQDGTDLRLQAMDDHAVCHEILL